ncbi:hypothetical protein SK069_06750 [Patulibacter brassicae]|uniref:BPL/LPL catalytic domain-containing protein n=1 Tax=Patulibacter brassicae TaxID=1705717 RepID=A0ABU4VHH7_9ACTN|nr:hypothetical protein [Patulibacter brassicae]MDX8151282.1 hypothetical protein [Patulibacter brassicae]
MSTRLWHETVPGDPLREMALSHALLQRVAAGELPPILRVAVPGPTLALSRLDARAGGFGAAVAASRRHGFVPVVRLGGGHAAAYGPGSLLVEWFTPQAAALTGNAERYAAFGDALVGTLRALGVPATERELPGEYCAGAHSVALGDRVKVAGVSQRVVQGAALVTAMVLLRDDPPIGPVLRDVYAALAIEWRPETAGAIADVQEPPPVAALTAGLATRFGAEKPWTPDAATTRLADALVDQHRP